VAPPSLPSLDNLSTLRQMHGLLDRESSPKEVDDDDDDDDDNGLERWFLDTPHVESLPSDLRPPPPAPKASPSGSEPVSSAPISEPVSSASAPDPRASVPCPCLLPLPQNLSAPSVHCLSQTTLLF
jgi:hypothetical protein